jgi:hypothetical protein
MADLTQTPKLASPRSTTSSWLMQNKIVPTTSVIRTVLRRCGRYPTTRIASRHVAQVGVEVAPSRDLSARELQAAGETARKRTADTRKQLTAEQNQIA